MAAPQTTTRLQRSGTLCLRTARKARNAKVTLTPSRLPGTRYSQPWCQPRAWPPNAIRLWNEPASTIDQNRAAGIIDATVSAASLARAGRDTRCGLAARPLPRDHRPLTRPRWWGRAGRPASAAATASPWAWQRSGNGGLSHSRHWLAVRRYHAGQAPTHREGGARGLWGRWSSSCDAWSTSGTEAPNRRRSRSGLNAIEFRSHSMRHSLPDGRCEGRGPDPLGGGPPSVGQADVKLSRAGLRCW